MWKQYYTNKGVHVYESTATLTPFQTAETILSQLCLLICTKHKWLNEMACAASWHSPGKEWVSGKAEVTGGSETKRTSAEAWWEAVVSNSWQEIRREGSTMKHTQHSSCSPFISLFSVTHLKQPWWGGGGVSLHSQDTVSCRHTQRQT